MADLDGLNAGTIVGEDILGPIAPGEPLFVSDSMSARVAH